MFLEAEEYNKQALKADIKQAKLGMILLGLPLVLFLFNDYQLFGLSTDFYLLAAIRFGFLSASLALFAYLGRFKNYRSYEYTIFTWGIWGVLVNILISASRPQNFLFHTIQTIIIVVIAYLVVPQRLSFKSILALFASVGCLFLIVLLPQPLSTPALFSITFSLVLTNIIGFSSSRLIQSLRVKEFKAHKEIVESERKYREFAESLPEIVFELNDKGNIIYTNKKAFETLGYNKEEIEHINLFKLIAPEDHSKAKENFNILLSGQKSSGNEYTLVHKNGARLPVIVFAEQIVDKNDKAAVRGIIVNLSAIKSAERKLSILYEKIGIVGKLTRHDVNNKLSIIMGYSFLLKKKYSDHPDIIENLIKIEQAVKNSEKMFMFAKMYEQIGEEELKYIEVEKTINEAVALLSNLNLKLVYNCKGLKVLADSGLIQLFYNLIDNTVKHSKHASAIKIYQKISEQDNLELIYEDDGVGILEENKKEIFREGFSTGGSTGFGLFLSKKMIEGYDWTIQEVGKPGVGAQFVITIPKLNKTGQVNYQIQTK